MDKAKTWLKGHWLYLLAGLVVLYLVITWLRTRAAAAAASGAAAPPPSQTGTTTTSTTSDALAAQQDQEATQLALAKLQSGTQLALASLGAGVQTQQSAAQTAAANSTIQAQLARAQLSAQTQQSHDLYSLLGNTIPQLITAFTPKPPAPAPDYGTDGGTTYDNVDIGSPAPLVVPGYTGQDILAA